MALSLSRNFVRHASRLVYSKYGVPTEVVKLEQFDEPVVTDDDDVVVKMLAAPIHPADINLIQGTYGLKSTFPAICGGEGVGRVLEVGAKVVSLRPGDVVFPTGNMSGTWTSHYKSKEAGFMKVSEKLGIIAAATLRTNPATAYRMLKDFVRLNEGDVVIQNGSNSAVGTAVIQICKAFNLKSVNIVRDRENLDELKSELHQLGADYVLTEQELRQTKIFRDDLLPKPRLGLNCVGGQSSTDLMQCLGHKGVHVTYGGMSLKPVTASASALIFKDISFRGFWLSRWLDEHAESDELFQMYDHLTDMSLNGLLLPPKHQIFDLSDHISALEESTKGFKKGKVIFMMDN